MRQFHASSPRLIEAPTASLEPGMYVVELDRPWLETPFTIQGFYVRSDKDVNVVRSHCDSVYVDPARYDRKLARSRRAPPQRHVYTNDSSLKGEFEAAHPQLESAADAMKRVFEQVRDGQNLHIRAVQNAIGPLVDSVLRNDEAMAALIRIKAKGDYLFNHSLSNAVWAAVLGRHLGLDVNTLQELAVGAALLDVGMTQLPDPMLRRSGGLSRTERAVVHGHVNKGLELLGSSGRVPAGVLEVVRSHHERHDGSGYPRGIAGNTIPLLGRIAGLVDSYDAMITPRPYAATRSSFEAMQELADLKGRLFQTELIEQFIQAIGLFPTGTIVQLNSGEIGVVVAQNLARRLKPKLVIALDANHRRLDKLVIVDLANYSPEHHAKTDLWIVKELESGAFGIQSEEFFL